MKVSWKQLQNTCLVIVASMLFATGSYTAVVKAATISDFAVSLSSDTANSSGVEVELTGTTQSSADLTSILIRFTNTSGGSTKPTHSILTGATLNETVNLGSGWEIDTSSAGTGLLTISPSSSASVAASTAFSITLGGITNSAIDDCDPQNNGLVDTCFIKITTRDSGGNVDTATASYSVYEDPFFEYQVEEVASGSTHNGVTSSISSTVSAFEFGILDQSTPVKYVTQKITVRTNAPGGYRISASLANNIHGEYDNAEFDQFGALNATWETPQPWSTPDGQAANNNSGWFAANTSDTRVTGWSGGSGKFGPMGTIPRVVAFSSAPDRTGTVIYVSYALGINALQGADVYTGRLSYNVQAIY